MFSYFGSKSKIINLYPCPIHSTIIEPFAGSARYSLKFFDREIVLIEKDSVIVELWHYLQQTTPKRILSLPDVENATELAKIKGFSQLDQAEKILIGFCSNGGSAVPKNFSGRMNFNSWNRDKKRIAESLYKIRHWNVICGDYSSVQNKKATWFVDSPYQKQGKWYRCGSKDIDYVKLGEWCKSRKGQVIVCENMGADWLPFVHLRDIPFTHFKTDQDKKKKTAEAVYIQ